MFVGRNLNVLATSTFRNTAQRVSVHLPIYTTYSRTKNFTCRIFGFYLSSSKHKIKKMCASPVILLFYIPPPPQKVLLKKFANFSNI